MRGPAIGRPAGRRPRPYRDPHPAPRTHRRLLSLLDELCVAHAPPGSEDEIDVLLTRRLEGLVRRVWRDAAGNVIAHVAGRAGASGDGPLLLNAHKDEIALMVKRVEDDGRLRVRPIGGAHPWKWGEGPVDLLADDGTVIPAALGFGPAHVSAETPLFRVTEGRRGLTWDLACVDPKLSRAELAARGVHAGTKVVLERTRKRPRVLGDYVCAHALDDRGGIAVLLEVAAAMHAGRRARRDGRVENADGGGRRASEASSRRPARAQAPRTVGAAGAGRSACRHPAAAPHRAGQGGRNHGLCRRPTPPQPRKAPPARVHFGEGSWLWLPSPRNAQPVRG